MTEVFQKYQKAGFACLPTKENKAPASNTWKDGVLTGYENTYGIGIICGKISDGLECLDFDNHFGDAKENISAFISEVRDIFDKYKLPIESTVSGGYHLLYRCDKVGGNQKLASRPKLESERWRPDAIIETRGEGGYFVADPTPGYKVIRNDLLDVQTITTDERERMIEVAKSFNTWNEPTKTDFESRDKPGDVFNGKVEAIDQMRGALQRAGWTEVKDGQWRRPGKKDGISATLGRVADNVFYNFSANGHPFNEGGGYTPFQVISLLDYNGDFSAFAKEISERYELNRPAINKQKPEVKPEIEYEKIMNNAFIDLDIPIQKPPVIMRVRNHYTSHNNDTRLFTLGNFSAITGKSKSKKTFLASLLLASASGNVAIQDKIISDIPEGKDAILLFDTEQSRYDAYISASRVPSLIGEKRENFGVFDLREYTPKERCGIINYTLNKYKKSLGYIVIDGIADLATAINDEEEATRVVSMLMKWTKDFNCHITVIIHQNKNDNYATGHLGSAILKKAECVISVEKDANEVIKSHVKCDLIRGALDFNDFSFTINDSGLPIIDKSTYNNDNF